MSSSFTKVCSNVISKFLTIILTLKHNIKCYLLTQNYITGFLNICWKNLQVELLVCFSNVIVASGSKNIVAHFGRTIWLMLIFPNTTSASFWGFIIRQLVWPGRNALSQFMGSDMLAVKVQINVSHFTFTTKTKPILVKFKLFFFMEQHYWRHNTRTLE